MIDIRVSFSKNIVIGQVKDLETMSLKNIYDLTFSKHQIVIYFLSLAFKANVKNRV